MKMNSLQLQKINIAEQYSAWSVTSWFVVQEFIVDDMMDPGGINSKSKWVIKNCLMNLIQGFWDHISWETNKNLEQGREKEKDDFAVYSFIMITVVVGDIVVYFFFLSNFYHH